LIFGISAYVINSFYDEQKSINPPDHEYYLEVYERTSVLKNIMIVVTLIAFLFLILLKILKSVITVFVCKAFGKATGFRVAGFFFPMITLCIPAFGNSQYEENITEIIPEYGW